MSVETPEGFGWSSEVDEEAPRADIALYLLGASLAAKHDGRGESVVRRLADMAAEVLG